MNETRSSRLSLNRRCGGAPPGTCEHPLIWNPQRANSETASDSWAPPPIPGQVSPPPLPPTSPSLRPGVLRFPCNPQVHGPFQSADSFRANFLKFSVEYLKRLQSTPQPLPHGVLDPEQWRPHQPPLSTPTAPFLWGADNWRGSLPACPNKLQRDWLPPYSRCLCLLVCFGKPVFWANEKGLLCQ